MGIEGKDLRFPFLCRQGGGSMDMKRNRHIENPQANTVLRVAVSTRALFDLTYENGIFEREGAAAYVDYQVRHENEILAKGAAFSLIEALLRLNGSGGDAPDRCRTEIMIMSRNSAEVSLRIFHSIQYYGLDITRAVFTTGQSLAPYLTAFGVDLYLSANEADVAAATDEGIAAGLIMTDNLPRDQRIEQIRIAFDGDAVLFSDESERIFQNQGLKAFNENEQRRAMAPLSEGPFAHFLKLIASIQKEYPDEHMPIRTALVTARSAPAHERVIRTLRSWGVRIDESFFMGGEDKAAVVAAFGAHIFFDDNDEFIRRASSQVLSARVVYPKRDFFPSGISSGSDENADMKKRTAS